MCVSVCVEKKQTVDTKTDRQTDRQTERCSIGLVLLSARGQCRSFGASNSKPRFPAFLLEQDNEAWSLSVRLFAV